MEIELNMILLSYSSVFFRDDFFPQNFQEWGNSPQFPAVPPPGEKAALSKACPSQTAGSEWLLPNITGV